MTEKHDHGAHCSHGHHHHHDHAHHVIGNIRLAFALNLAFSVIELVGGLWIGSVAITADAVHDFGDSISLGIAWALERFAGRSRDNRFNFGYRRFSLLSALISGLIISTGSIIIIFEALKRFQSPNPPSGVAVMAFAVLGLAVNGFAAWRLSRGSTENEKMLTWHLFEDMMGWAIVLVGGFVMALTDIAWIDPALAVGLSIFILYNVLNRLKDTAYLFLQGRPASFDEKKFLADALAVPGVEHVDHLAVWSLDGQTSILSARLHLHSVRDPLAIETVKAGVRLAATSQGAKATLETCLAAQVPHEEIE